MAGPLFSVAHPNFSATVEENEEFLRRQPWYFTTCLLSCRPTADPVEIQPAERRMFLGHT